MNSGAKKVGWTGISRRNSSPESILFCLAPFFGSEGWGFESLRARHRFQKLTSRSLIFFTVVSPCWVPILFLAGAGSALVQLIDDCRPVPNA